MVIALIDHQKQARHHIIPLRLSLSRIYSRRQTSVFAAGICVVLQKKKLPPPQTHCSNPVVFPTITSWKSECVCMFQFERTKGGECG